VIGQTRIDELEIPDPSRGPVTGRHARSYWRESWDRLLDNRIGLFCGGVILLIAVIALLAPLISQFVTHATYRDQDLANIFAPPSRAHWLGTDELGRDTLTRLVYGARVSMTVGFLTVGLSLSVGGAVGLLSGFYGGWVDNLLMRLVDMLLSIPSIFLFILLSILFRPDAVGLSAIIAFVGWGGVARLVRGEVISVRGREFMIASRSVGAGDLRLMLRHLLPNVLHVMIVAASLAVGQIILVEAALSFLGLGIQPPTASWGNMLTLSRQYFYHSVYLVIFPGICIFVTVLCTNIFGNAVRDSFDPRLR
jgi:peptide/nickel transport system permease protein